MRAVAEIAGFLSHVHPYDSLPPEELTRVAGVFGRKRFSAGELIYRYGDQLAGLYVVESGEVCVTDTNGEEISHLGPRNSFGERGLSRGGLAATTAEAREDTEVLLLPAPEFRALIRAHPSFQRFFDRTRPAEKRRSDLNTSSVASLMARNPVTCQTTDTVAQAAKTMRDHKISCLGVVDDGKLVGILTNSDLVRRVMAVRLSFETPVAQVMTKDPICLPSSAIGSDVLHIMLERGVGHLPVVDAGRFTGIITQTDLTRFQAISAAALVQDVAAAHTAEDLAAVTARIPQLLVQLVAAGNRHEVVTRLITNVADACTRRLLDMAVEELGPAPVPWLWLACGSQGRQEQTGVSDQDNCLFLHDDVTDADMPYFRQLAKIVCDGLDTCGYVYCPGDMMATNPRWCKPLRIWRDYFSGWIEKPDPMAQMLASVMYDLRPIGGDETLFAGLQAETLERSADNSIFVAHMSSNALKHTPPLGLLRGIATIRSGEHKNHMDMKHNGVVPVVDLGRIYALQGQLPVVNTRARLEAGIQSGVVSPAGGADLLAAYDLIADERLQHQANQIKAGEAPDNFLAPADLSDFQRSHLRDAFVVIRSMQSALGHGRATPG